MYVPIKHIIFLLHDPEILCLDKFGDKQIKVLKYTFIHCKIKLYYFLKIVPYNVMIYLLLCEL